MSTSSPSQAPLVWTIGHSRHSIDAFLGLLRQHDVGVLVDVRSQPASRFSPHFARRALERAVTASAMAYLFMGDTLGGRPEARACYGEDGVIDYDRVEAQDFYQRGIAQLLDRTAPPLGGAAGRGSPTGDRTASPLGGAAGRGSPSGDGIAPPLGGAAGRGSPTGDGIARFRVCVMCAEEDPSRCHRRLLITRTLVRRGVAVHHIRGSGAIETEDELRAGAEARQLSLLGSDAPDATSASRTARPPGKGRRR